MIRFTIAYIGSTFLRRTLLVLLVLPATVFLVLASLWHALFDGLGASCRSFKYHFVPDDGLPVFWHALVACWRGEQVGKDPRKNLEEDAS